MPICAACGKENPDEARFCLACGEAIASEAPPQRETRKTVTVLFCDVAGYTAAGERLDPEALRRIQSRYFEEARAALERHGGTVEKFAGDAVMAVFGVPQVHEDDALRAVRAATDLQAAVEPLGLQVRIGVNTGEVVTGDSDALVTGDAVNVAARLEAAAEPGAILIGEPTNRLVSAAVTCEPVAPIQAKGKTEPLRAWRLLDVSDGVGAAPRRLDAPMVGRERELDQLRQAWERARHERRCHLFTILGPAGVGKSRLVAELAQGVRDESTVVTGRCLSYGEGITYWPLVEILGQVQDRVDELLQEEEKADVIAARLAAVSGASDSAGSSEEISWAARKLFERLGRERPLVVVLDDLHWAEPTFIELIEHVADWSRAAPILLLCLARPELLEAQPTWGGGKLNATSILLEPLSDDEAESLVEALAGEAFPQQVRGRILAAAEGNPLFVEQMLAMTAENGQADSELQVPGTIQALLAARLDRLLPAERATLEHASVIGKEFDRTALAQLSPEDVDLASALNALVRKELIRPVDDETFGFRHLLIRDAAYDAMPKELRARLHEYFAGWLESEQGEYEEIVAYHLAESYGYRHELGHSDDSVRALGRRAADKLEEVGHRALARGDVRAAESALASAIELLPADDRSRPRLLQELAYAGWETLNPTEADALFADAEAAARATGDQGVEVRSRLERARIRFSTDLDGEVMRDEAERAVEAFRELGDDAGMARALVIVSMLTGGSIADMAASRAAAEQALEHAAKAGDEHLEAMARNNRWNSVWWSGAEPDEAIELAEEDRAWARARGNLLAEATALEKLGRAAAAGARFDEARALLGEAKRIAEDLGRTGRIATVHWLWGGVEMLAGDASAAEEHYRAAYVFLESRQDYVYLSSLAGEFAHALVAQGRDEEAIRISKVSEEYTGEGDLDAQIGWRTSRARALAHLGEHAQAEALVREALEFDVLPVHRAPILVHFAEILDAAGRRPEASEAAREALSVFEAAGHVAHARNARALLDEWAAEPLPERD